MKNLLKSLALLTALSLSGCAGQSPLQGLSDALDPLKDNLLSDAVLIDAQTTLQDVESWGLTGTEYMGAKSCAEFIVAAHPEKVAIIEEIQSLTKSIDTEILGLANGTQSPMLIRRLTAAKYAPQGMPGADISPRIEALKLKAVKLISGARDACMNLVDDQLLIRIGLKAFGGGL